MNKDEFFNKIKEAESYYYKNDPCHHCVGNGCDDCRDCKQGEVSYKMYKEVYNLKNEYKEKFGADYDKEVEALDKARREKIRKENLLKEVWETCTFDEIIDAGFFLNKCSSQHLLDAAEEFVIKQEEDKDFIESLNELCEKTAKSKLPWAHEVMMILCDYFNEYDLMDYFDNDDLIEHLDGTWEMDNYINNKEIDAVNDYKVCNPDFTIEECIQYLSDVPFYNLRRYFCDLTSNCYYCSDEQLIKDIKNKLNIK